MKKCAWFNEHAERKVKFIIRLLLRDNPFLLGYIWCFLRVGRYIIRRRKDGSLYLAFKKVYPLKALYVERVFKRISEPVIHFNPNSRRFHIRFILPFIYDALLHEYCKRIFPKIIRENPQVYRGVLTALIDLYGKLQVSRKFRLVFRVPDDNLQEIVLEKIKIDKISIRRHKNKVYRYLIINNKDMIEEILKTIEPINPERILEIAEYRGAISHNKRREILKKLEVTFSKRILRRRERCEERLSIPENEKAYILGFATGDLTIRVKGNRVIPELCTTHPEAMLLFHRIFEKYGKIIHIQKLGKKTDDAFIYLRAYLNKKQWEFLIKKGNLEAIRKETQEKEKFIHFLAGFFDAEGTIIIKKQSKTQKTQVEAKIASGRKDILKYIKKKLAEIGIKSEIYKEKDKECYKLTTTGKQAIKLLKTIPIKHTEKTRKTKIALKHHAKPWTKQLEQKLNQYKQQIKKQKQQLKTTIIPKYNIKN